MQTSHSSGISFHLWPWPPKPNPNFNLKFPEPPLYILSYGRKHYDSRRPEHLNIHSPCCCNAAEFIHLLDCNILIFLHTSEAQLWIGLLPTLHSVISDHMKVSLELPHLSIHCRKNCQISFRNIKNIHPVILETNFQFHLHATSHLSLSCLSLTIKL